jgi:hypothetical protein
VSCNVFSIHSTKQYQPWTPEVFQDFNEIPNPATLTEHQAVLSLLFALRDSMPAPQPSLTALPALGSSTLAAVQQRAAAAVAAAAATDALDVSSSWRLHSSEHADQAVQQQQQQNHVAVRLERLADHLQEQQKAAAAGTWLSTAAAATQLLEQMPLDAAAAAVPCTGGITSSSIANDTSGASNGTASSSFAMQPMVECLAQQLQLASQPHLLMPLGLHADAAASDAASCSSVDQSCRKGARSSKGGGQKGEGVTQAAVDAAAAVEAAAALQSSVLPLMRLSAAELGSGAAHMMPGQQQQQQRDAAWTARTATNTQSGLPAINSSGSSRKIAAPGSGRSLMCSSAAAVVPPSAAAVRSAAEEELVASSCLAVQGVWSAVDQLWSLAVGDPAASASNRCGTGVSYFEP